MEMVINEKMLERGQKYLDLTWSQQEGVRKRIKNFKSAVELAKGIISCVKRAFKVSDVIDVLELAAKLGAPEDEVKMLNEARETKYQELSRAEYEADKAKADRLWEEARPELEKAGLVAEPLKCGKYYRAKYGRTSKQIEFRDYYYYTTCGVWRAWYKSSPRSKQEYVLFEMKRDYALAKNAETEIKFIKHWQIKPMYK